MGEEDDIESNRDMYDCDKWPGRLRALDAWCNMGSRVVEKLYGAELELRG